MDGIQSASTNGNYSLMKEDAEGLYKLKNKFVKVQLIKDTEFIGYVHSIDPDQHSIILLSPDKDFHTVNIIPGHAILNVVEVNASPRNKEPERKIAVTNSTDDIIKKKERLMSWFKRNLLPITESDKKILFGNVAILPPYDITNICTDNPVVAMQVRKIIENMPQDFDPDK